MLLITLTCLYLDFIVHFEHYIIYFNSSKPVHLCKYDEMCSFLCFSAGVSLDLSQPAAALQSQKAQASALPLIQSQTNSNQAAPPQKQVHWPACVLFSK